MRALPGEVEREGGGGLAGALVASGALRRCGCRAVRSAVVQNIKIKNIQIFKIKNAVLRAAIRRRWPALWQALVSPLVHCVVAVISCRRKIGTRRHCRSAVVGRRGP